MPHRIRRVDYFYTSVPDESGAACEVLSQLAEVGVNLLAFAAVPMGPFRTQLTLFPEDRAKMEDETRRAGITIDGPHPALLVQGDDDIGVLAKVHRQLADSGVSVYASSGVADGKGSYGYLVHVRPQDIDRAVAALDV